MEANLAFLNVVVAFLGVLLVALAYFEYSRLRKIRADFNEMRDEWRQEQHRIQKAQQRVIASYSIKDLDHRIELLKTAIDADPATFNGYNALGYAYLEKGDRIAALDSFHRAINAHPDAKEGYFDLARLYMADKRYDLVKTYLSQAIKHDPSSEGDIKGDPELALILEGAH